MFTSTQPNISVQVPFTDSSAIVSFPTPTASDNTPGVTGTQISGPASGSAFPLGTISDDFNSSRWFASAALFGDIQRDDLAIRPTLCLNYFRETTDAFVNGLGATIGGQEIQPGDLTMGAAFVWNTTAANGWTSSPFVKVDGIWTYEASGGTGRLSTIIPITARHTHPTWPS